MLLLAAVVLLAANVAAASAIEMPTYGKQFCEGGKVHDYERVLDRMPPVPRVPESESLPFGPRNMSIYSTAFSRVIVGRGGFGYAFVDDTFGVRPEVRLFWDVTTSLSRVDRRGEVLREVDSESQYLGVLKDVSDSSFWLDTPPGPALYRYDIEFRDHRSGEILGSYSEYLRVVRPRYNVRIAPIGRTFAPGQPALARVENPGTTWAFFGLAYAVERYAHGAWEYVPISSGEVVWPLVGLTMQGGGSGWCMRYRIPADAEPGRYRFVKSIAPWGRERNGQVYTANFRVKR